MKPVLNVKQVRSLDAFCINELGISDAVLMENASRSVYNFIKSNYKNNHHRPNVLIINGVGNNGGDGLALARLMIDDFDVETILIGNLEKMSEVTKRNYQILVKMNGNIDFYSENRKFHFKKYDIIIDALFGVGFKGELNQNIKELFRDINNSKAVKIAIDVPSGLNADTGECDENAFIADYTVTMFAEKLGFYLSRNNLVGEIITADMGVPRRYSKELANNFILEEENINKYVNNRNNNFSKFDFGKVGIIAGSHKYSGAAALTANASIKAGAGLVYLFSTNAHSSLLPEIIFEKLLEKDGFIDEENYNFLFDKLQNMDSIIIGPGIGKNNYTLRLIERIIHTIPANIPILIDADALNVVNKVGKLRENIIITPHLGEFAEIIGKNRNEINRYNDCKIIANDVNCTVLLKGHNTLISDGEITYINTNGNPGMATAGSGDVLSGIIGALLSQGIETIQAGAIGAYLHGMAGDLYAKKYNQMSLSASDIINEMKNIIQKSDE